MLEEPNSGLPILVREECRDLMAQIAEKTARIEAKTKKVKELAEQTDMARRLQTMPGVGPMTALAIEAFAPSMTSFRRGRDFSAWLGLVPRQHSSICPRISRVVMPRAYMLMILRSNSGKRR